MGMTEPLSQPQVWRPVHLEVLTVCLLPLVVGEARGHAAGVGDRNRHN